MSFSQLKSLLQRSKQDHLLQFWNEITEEEKECLIQDINKLNISEVIDCFHRAVLSDKNKQQLSDEKIKPIPSDAIEFIKNSSSEKLRSYEKLGLQEIAKGKAAVVLLAGGQGTRLGVDFPKGMYNINLPSERTLFQLQALKIKKLQNLAQDTYGESKDITWYIMTSDATHESTVTYFEKNGYFGLKKENVIAFKQNTLPCFTFDGKIILDEKHQISRAPDGNGGLYAALKTEGILSDMKSRGIHSVHVFSVDNVLVKVADPIFIGYCLSRAADCGVKVVKKRSSDEPVGVLCKVEDVYSVVEYSEISPTAAELQDASGNLIFSAGNICNHYFTVPFLQSISEQYENSLDLHVAKKKIPFIDENGVKCKPSIPNGIKIEKFVFDVFRFSQNLAAWEVLREDEFSGLKNADSAKIDCPSTARSDVLNLHKRWLLKAGANKVEGDVEICPLLSYAGENLSNVAKDKTITGPVCLM